jgi:hypothetical protein
MPERIVVAVAYDPKVGYRTTGGPELPVVIALSLGGLRRRIEAALMPEEPIIILNLDRAARFERDRRRRGSVGGAQIDRVCAASTDPFRRRDLHRFAEDCAMIGFSFASPKRHAATRGRSAQLSYRAFFRF